MELNAQAKIILLGKAGLVPLQLHIPMPRKRKFNIPLVHIYSLFLYPGMEGFAKSIDWYIDRYKITGAFSDQFDFSKP
jgi:hypothetical protein